MISLQVGRRARELALVPARLLDRLGFTPNGVTIAGCLANCAVGLVLAAGAERVGGVLVLLVNAFDMLDGALARLQGRRSTFGAFLDSTLDRYSEAALLLGVAWLYLRRGNPLVAGLAWVAMVGSLMVSYARARAEGLGLDAEVGVLARPERIVLLGGALILRRTPWALALMAILTNLTAIQRIRHVRKLTQGE